MRILLLLFATLLLMLAALLGWARSRPASAALLLFVSNREFGAPLNPLKHLPASPPRRINHIYRMLPDGGSQHRITGGEYDHFWPMWSPAGLPASPGWIAYEGGEWGAFDVYRVRPNGEHQQRLTTNPEDDWSATWSPDGRWIAYMGQVEGNADIYVVRADDPDSPPRRLTFHPAEDSEPSWSPDGRWIAFESRRTGETEIFLLPIARDAAGGFAPRYTTPIRLTRQAVDNTWPSWSPDSQWVVYQARTASHLNADIYRIRVDGGAVERLTTHPATDERGMISPDGRWLAFASLRDGNFEVYLLHLATRRVRRLTHTPTAEIQPSWSPIIDLRWQPALPLGVGLALWLGVFGIGVRRRKEATKPFLYERTRKK